MKNNDGGPAFPVIGGHSQSFGPFGETDSLTIGMSLRDYFAAKAMQGMLAYPGCSQRGSHHNNNAPDGAALMAYGYADAMLLERAK